MGAIHIDKSFYTSFTKSASRNNVVVNEFFLNKKRIYLTKKNDYEFYFLNKSDIKNIIEYIDCDEFLPKIYWKKTVKKIITDGITKGVYKSLIIKSITDNKVISYLDFRVLSDSLIEIGFCFTVKEHRNKGFIKLLMRKLLSLHKDHNFTITTHERNYAMQQAILALGFHESTRTLGDRVNGESTICYLYTR